jgi:periplasmic copper chaperone A
MWKTSHSLLVAASAAFVASPAGAHVMLESRQATVGAPYKAVFAVPHGCAGSATVKIRVQIPEGVIAVKPMPKPGWSVESIKGKYAAEYDYDGAKLSEGVKEVQWSGGKLPDDNYDEFVISTFLTSKLKPNTMLYFPVVQECEQGVNRWIDIPEGGHAAHMQDGMHMDMHEGKWPAPGVKLTPKS